MNKEPKRITCLVIEDEPLAIEIILDYIGRRKDLKLIGLISELSEIKSFLENHIPAIIFLDLIIPPGDSGGFHFGKLPKTSSIIIVSGIPLNHYRGVLPNGNIIELPKPFSFESFDRCVNEVIAVR